MSLTSERLYDLLPAIVRERDAERGEPLRALFRLLAGQGAVVEADLDRLYENLFIETCDEWVVPYLGDLLGVRNLQPTGALGFSQRSRVANSLAYRRRKGTATMLEQLAFDTTGWRARAGEFFELLASNQWLNHLRLHSLQVPDLRRGEALERIGTAFEEARHFVDVRRLGVERGRYNLPNVGLFLWRLQAGPLSWMTARAADPGGATSTRGRFRFHPLGLDAPLFNRPRTETSINTLATERHVPGRLRRRPLHDETESMRVALVNGGLPPADWFGREPVLQVAYRVDPADRALQTVPPEEILVADLSDSPVPVPEVWLRPPSQLAYTRAADGAVVQRPIQVAVDPVLGRLAFPAGVEPVEVRVSAVPASPGDVGGGAYDRRQSVGDFPLGSVGWQAGVGRDVVADPAQRLFRKLEDAVAAWNALPAGTTGVIALLDNGSYPCGNVTLVLPAGSRLLLVAADWPETSRDGGGSARLPGRLTPSGLRAHLLGNITVQSGAGSELWLDGLLIEGDLRVANAGGAGMQKLRVAHSTLAPVGSTGVLEIEDGHGNLSVEVRRSILRRLDVAAELVVVQVIESVVDAGTTAALQVTRAAVEIEGSTIVGSTTVRRLSAGNSLFLGPVQVERRQAGCVRFSFVPDDSVTPRRHRCQPDLAREAATTEAGEQAILARMVPGFTGEHYGHPAYLQLTRTTPVEIRTGADDGSEMGVWSHLRQPQREANLRASLDEYLRFGLEAGLIFVT